MNRFKLTKTLVLVVLAAAAAWAAQAADLSSKGAAAAARGAYAVTFHIKAPTTVPDGATVTCKARVTPNIPALQNVMGDPVAVESVAGTAKVANSSASCTVELPVSLAVSNLQNGALLSYEIDAYTGSAPVFARAQQGIILSSPRSGGVTALTLDVAF